MCQLSLTSTGTFLIRAFFFFRFNIYTWIGCKKPDDSVASVGHRHRVFSRSVDEIALDKAVFIHMSNLFHCDITGNALHSHYVETGTVNMERMSGVKRNTLSKRELI